MKALIKYLTKKVLSDHELANFIQYYYESRPGGGRRKRLIETAKLNIQSINDFHCFWDFAAKPYALGDIVLWGIQKNIQAIENGNKSLVIHILADPSRPSPINQPYIVASNYMSHYLAMLPAFYSIPNCVSTVCYHDRDRYEDALISHELLTDSENHNLLNYSDSLNYPSTFRGYFHELNRFYDENGYIPQLKTDLSESGLFDYQALFTHRDSFFVTVHIRQRKNQLGQLFKGDLGRDSPIHEWKEFFNWANDAYPNVMFLLVGTGKEYSKQFFRCRNVYFLKEFGFGLSEELKFISQADLFMGANSGPAMVATLSSVPYVIFINNTNKQYTSELCDVDVGAEKYKFAQNNQRLCWEDPSSENLKHQFMISYRDANDAH